MRQSVGGLVLFVALGGCAATGVTPRPVLPLPPGRPAEAWLTARVGEGARALVALLPQGAEATVRALRMEAGHRVALLDASGQARAAQGTIGGAPGEGGQRWVRMRRLRGSTLAGWCARGVRVVDTGAEGFAQRVLVVDRLLLVGREAGGLWGVWVEGLALTSDGWRVLPWISWAQAIEAPRRDHGDAQLWDCDLGVRPSP
jgi:hypothetical protein